MEEEKVGETPAEEPKAEETPSEDLKSKEPVEGELHDPAPANTLKAPQAPDDIHAQIRAKLENRTPGGEGSQDPFNPTSSVPVTKTQMEAMAEEGGFPLNRGREVGLRLLARAQRNRR